MKITEITFSININNLLNFIIYLFIKSLKFQKWIKLLLENGET